MNNLLLAKYHQLSTQSKTSLKKKFSDAPRMQKFLELLERSSKRLGIKEAVHFIYSEEKEPFETLRNRFFKLRKKLLEDLDQSETNASSAGVDLMPLEAELYRCRQLVGINKYQPAKQSLEQLINTCWARNIFEILPDAIHLLIFCNLALNFFKENERLNDELDKANELLYTLNKQRQLARKIYQLIVERRPLDTINEIFIQFRNNSEKYKDYPRFRLYYHFIHASQGAIIFSNDQKSLKKSFAIVKEITGTHPEMPVAFYEPYGKEMLRFYLAYGEGMTAFQEGDTFIAYQKLMEAWSIMETVPGLRSKKTESNYSNKIAIEVATKRYNDALKTAEELLDFLLEQKEEEKRLKAYSEIVQIYTYAFPSIKAPDPLFLDKKMDEYIKTVSKENDFLYFGSLLLKAVFLFQNGKEKEAAKICDTKGYNEFLETLGIGYYNDIIRLGIGHDEQTADKMYQAFRKKLEEESRPEIVFPLQRAVNMLEYLKKKTPA